MQRRPLILVSLLLAAFVINLDITIVNVALPTLVRELHASNSQLQWVVDAYSLVFASLLLAGRQPLRPPRPQGISARRPRRLRSRECRRWPDQHPRAADRRPLLHGSRRRDDLPDHPVADLKRVHRARRARPRDRPLGRDHRRRRSRSGRSSGAGCSSSSGGRASSSRWHPSPLSAPRSSPGACRPRAIRTRTRPTARDWCSRAPRWRC